jgi:KDO2-lipid IV(A) lauroyltransferase
MAAAEAAYAHAGLAHGPAAGSLAAANLKFSWQYYARLASLVNPRCRRDLIESVEPESLDRLNRGLSAPEGLIIVTAHLGDFEIAAAWLRQSTEREVVAVVDKVAPRARQALFDRVRHSCGLVLRPAESTGLADLRADLDAGRIITLMIDRRPSSLGVPVTFLDRAALASRGPHLLARCSGAMILSAATHTLSTTLRSVSFGEPYRAEALSPGQLTQRALDDVGAFVRRRPEQWQIPVQLSQLPFVTI